jgi:hypothetical protein
MASGQRLISWLHPCSTSNVALNTRTCAHGPLMGHPNWVGCDNQASSRTPAVAASSNNTLQAAASDQGPTCGRPKRDSADDPTRVGAAASLGIGESAKALLSTDQPRRGGLCSQPGELSSG